MNDVANEVVEEYQHLLQVQHFRLEPGDILAFVTRGVLSRHASLHIRSSLNRLVPTGVKIAVLEEGAYLAVMKNGRVVEEPNDQKL